MSAALPKTFHLPAETEQHAGTMMAWPTEKSMTMQGYEYPADDISATRAEVASIAKAIAKYEPLHLFVRDPKTGEGYGVKDTNVESAQALLGDVDNVTIHTTPNAHFLWARDNGPVLVRSRSGPINITWNEGDDPGIGFHKRNTSSEIVGLLLSFNQWGRKDAPNPDMYLAATAAETLGKSAVLAPFIGEGGALSWDGEGTMLATESSLLNPNRNPGVDKATMEQYFEQYFGVSKTIWIPGRRGEDITDDHIDALARFSAPGIVLLSKPFHLDPNDETNSYNAMKTALATATDARGRGFRSIDVPEPDRAKVLGEDYDPTAGPSVAYVNFHLVNGAVIMAAFGDEERDAEAKRIIGDAFPERVVEQVLLHQLSAQGGGIHCATQQIPA